MLCCFNVQICMLELVIQKLNTIQNTSSLALAFCETQSADFQKLTFDLTTQLAIIITGLLTPTFACNV